MHRWLANLMRTKNMVLRLVQPRAREEAISAQQEARSVHHRYIGAEQLLLGLVRDRDAAAGRAMQVLGISPDVARQQVLEISCEGEQR